jgi:hypothetical protein
MQARSETAEPIVKKSKTEMQDPNLVAENSESSLPTREIERKLRLDPACM